MDLTQEPDLDARPPELGELLVVAIGASAGGLDALRSFLADVPADLPCTFLLVQHLAEADHHFAADIFARLTPLQVLAVEDGQPMQPGRLCIAPANAIVQVRGGHFRLRPPRTASERRNPIDRCFQGLAESLGPRAIGIVLSGSGSDGALGLAAIGAAGGMTMAQAADTAAFADMPASVASAADHVLPPAGLAQILRDYAAHWQSVTAGTGLSERRREIQARLAEICDVLYRRTNHDFKHYKATTLVRRIERRMQVRALREVDAYVAELARDLQEPHTLFRDLLIGVTSFFREPEAFNALSERSIATLLKERGAEGTVRIWVPGCATGEEAYSIAMLAREQLDKLDHAPKVQIFATDVNERALVAARRGSYPQGIAAQMSPERLARFFVKRGRRYVVCDEIREMCLFSVHNLISDPPFSRLDLVSCRNLLIYLGSHLQKKLIPLFHYALRRGGYLFLGASESLTGHGELFRVIDARHRLAQRKDAPIHVPGQLGGSASATLPGWRGAEAATDADLGQLAQRILLDEFTPRYAIVTEEGQVVFLSEGADVFVQAPAGSFSSNIMRMVRRGLSVGLRTAFNQSLRLRRAVVRDIPTVHTAEGTRAVRLTVQPMPEMGRDDGLHMLVFQDLGPATRRPEEASAHHPDADAVIEALEGELLRTREDLERTVQDLEAANEELKSSNEELLSMNEELQSANEELETSKEEVQAANQALGAANADLENLLRATRIATLFLDRSGAIRSFTPATAEIYNLTAADVGRPLDHFTHRLENPPDLPDAAMMTSGEPVDDEVRSADGARWYLRRVLPYRTPEGQAAGLVVTFLDVTRQKEFERALQQSQRQQSFLLALNDRLRGLAAPAEVMLAASEMVGRFLGIARVGYGEVESGDVIVERDWDDGRIGSVAGRYPVRAFGEEIEATLDRGATLTIADVAADPRTAAPSAQAAFQAIGVRSVLAVPLVKGSRLVAMIYLHHPEPRDWPDSDVALVEDVAERTWAAVERARIETELRESETELRAVLDAAPAAIWIARDAESRIVVGNRASNELLRLSEGANASKTADRGERPVHFRVLDVQGIEIADEDLPVQRAARGETVSGFEEEVTFSDGSPSVFLLGNASPLFDEDGRSRGAVAAFVDVTERKRAEQAQREAADRLRIALYAARMGDWSWDTASDLVTLSERAADIFGIAPGPSITWTALQGLLHVEDAAAAKAAVEAALESFTEYAVEYRIARADEGGEVWVAASGLGTYAADGRATGMIGVVQDVTERRTNEEQQRLMVRELHHRVRNTLATVQAIIGSAARTAADAQSFYRSVADRIASLARTHTLLTGESWGEIDLRDLLALELNAYDVDGGGRVSLSGPPLRLASEKAVAIGMAVHELTTNSAKYGALSRPEGKVTISWTVGPDATGVPRLAFRWVERGGPRVEEPSRKGFGSRLLERVLGVQMQAEVAIAYEPEGVVFRMEAPVPGGQG